MPSAIVLGLHYAPFAYILIGGILRNMDANLEEAATILKASRFKIIRRITLPIVMPALLSTFLLVFSSSMSAYAVPQFLGGTDGFAVLTTTMKQFVNSGWYGQGYIMAVFMIIFGVSILAINQYMTGKRKSFTTVTGKSGQISYIKMGPWKYVVATLLVLLFAVHVHSAPHHLRFGKHVRKAGRLQHLYAGLLVLQRGYGQRQRYSRTYLRAAGVERPQKQFAAGAVLRSYRGHAGHSDRLRCGKTPRNKAGAPCRQPCLPALPYALYGQWGAAFLAIGTSFGIAKSFFILVLVGSIKYLPFASRSGINAMLQLSNEIEEAALIVNVPWWKRMLRIIFPIQKSTFMSGYLLPFTSCMRELSLFTLLASGATTLLTTLLEDWQQYWTQSANALNLLIILVVLLVNFLVNLLTGASIDKGVGG